jgi:hypothetical protein
MVDLRAVGNCGIRRPSVRVFGDLALCGQMKPCAAIAAAT